MPATVFADFYSINGPSNDLPCDVAQNIYPGRLDSNASSSCPIGGGGGGGPTPTSWWATASNQLLLLASADYTATYNSTGWGYLSIRPQRQLLIQFPTIAFFAAGFLEGFLTADVTAMHFFNIARGSGMRFSLKYERYLRMSFAYIDAMTAIANGSSSAVNVSTTSSSSSSRSSQATHTYTVTATASPVPSTRMKLLSTQDDEASPSPSSSSSTTAVQPPSAVSGIGRGEGGNSTTTHHQAPITTASPPSTVVPLNLTTDILNVSRWLPRYRTGIRGLVAQLYGLHSGFHAFWNGPQAGMNLTAAAPNLPDNVSLPPLSSRLLQFPVVAPPSMPTLRDFRVAPYYKPYSLYEFFALNHDMETTEISMFFQQCPFPPAQGPFVGRWSDRSLLPPFNATFANGVADGEGSDSSGFDDSSSDWDQSAPTASSAQHQEGDSTAKRAESGKDEVEPVANTRLLPNLAAIATTTSAADGNGDEHWYRSRRGDHCSAFIRVTRDDVLVGHNSWEDLNYMLRQIKVYHFTTDETIVEALPGDEDDVDDRTSSISRRSYQPDAYISDTATTFLDGAQQDPPPRSQQSSPNAPRLASGGAANNEGERETVNGASQQWTGGASVWFAGYPGTLWSSDDFYVTSRGLTLFETTVATTEPAFVCNVTPLSIPVMFRSMVASYLANSGAEWSSIFSAFNSGSYTAEWIVLDNKRISRGESASSSSAVSLNERGVVTVLDNFPGDANYFEDFTSDLQHDRFLASFNVPSIEEAFVAVGNAKLAMEQPGAGRVFSFYNNSRYLMLQRSLGRRHDGSSDEDPFTFEAAQHLIRYANWQTDPFAIIPNCNALTPCEPFATSPMLTIAARGDLIPKGAQAGVPDWGLGAQPRVAIDGKLFSWRDSQSSRLNREAAKSWFVPTDDGGCGVSSNWMSRGGKETDGTTAPRFPLPLFSIPTPYAMSFHVVAGPSAEPNNPLFQWSTSQYNVIKRHVGHPDRFNFSWIYGVPTVPLMPWEAEAYQRERDAQEDSRGRSVYSPLVIAVWSLAGTTAVLPLVACAAFSMRKRSQASAKRTLGWKATTSSSSSCPAANGGVDREARFIAATDADVPRGSSYSNMAPRLDEAHRDYQQKDYVQQPLSMNSHRWARYT